MSRNVRWHDAPRRATAWGAATLMLAVAACTGPSQPEPPGPIAAVAQLSPVKLISFEWTGGEGADSFRISRLTGGTATAVADHIPASEAGYELEVFLPDQLEAEYQVEACNSAGCTTSQTITLERDDLDLAIGYVKASAPSDEDRFGAAVALSADGRVLAVGAPREDGGGAGVNPPVDDALESSGAVYLYTRTDAGEWSGPVYLKAPVPGAADQFGSAVALSADGRVLAVGARAESGMSSGINPAHDDNAPGAGAVYVYELSGAGVWGEPTYIKAGQVDGGDAFGSDLALSDDGLVLAVSAPHEGGGGAGVDPPPDEMAVFAGAVWMYERTEGGPWGQTAYIKADQPGAGDQFGFSVALSGDGQLLAVGGPSEDGSGTGVDPPVNELGAASGAAWTYLRGEAGQWTFDAYIKASNTGGGDAFGSSVALSADGALLAVSAPLEDGSGVGIGSTPNESGMDTGAVYVYERGAMGAWSGPLYVKPGSIALDGQFGYDIAWSGDGTRLAIGTPQDSGGGTGIQPPPGVESDSSGAVWVYERSTDGGWSDGVRLKASNTGPDDVLGFAVALPHVPGVLAVGAPLEDGGNEGVGADQNDNSMPSAGAVYLY